jgi:hypothetical protein
MLAALIAGQRDPHALADLARKKMRAKMSVLRQALTGHFTGHHAFLPGMMPGRAGALTAQIDTLTARIEHANAPFAAQVAQLDEIPGIGVTTAQEIIAETGAGMTRFPAPRPPGLLVQVRAQGPPLRRAEQSRLHRPGQPPGSAAPSAKPPQPPPGPAPSSPPATRRSSSAAARNAPWPLSATPSSPSAGTCSPTPAPTSLTSARTGTTASPRSGANASSSPNWNACPARKSPSTTPPDNPRGTHLHRRHHSRQQPGSADAPPGAAACPLTDRFSIQHRSGCTAGCPLFTLRDQWWVARTPRPVASSGPAQLTCPVTALQKSAG